MAFTDAPIYARTSGYLKRWYFDIGAHVRQGQLLAEIETPELDQQLRQARADLATAQANTQTGRHHGTAHREPAEDASRSRHRNATTPPALTPPIRRSVASRQADVSGWKSCNPTKRSTLRSTA